MLIPWWLTMVNDNIGTTILDIDVCVRTPFQECGTVFTELYKYSFNLNQSNLFVFPEILTNKNGVLISEFKLPKKSEEERFKDLRYTIKTYRYLTPTFLSLGLIDPPRCLSDDLYIVHLENFFNSTADVLEYYLLNNPINISNDKSYYTGRIQLDLYRLLQEIYKLAKEGNPYCRWMLGFDTPLQIWFVITLQRSIFDLYNSPKSIRDLHYKISKNEKNKKFLEEGIVHYKNFPVLNITAGIEYTIGQLVLNNTIPVGSYYTRYRQGGVKQANLLRKGKLPPI